jgi:hypothetical protein
MYVRYRTDEKNAAAELRSKKYANPIRLFTVHADYVSAENAEQLSLKVISKATDVWLLADEIKKLVNT